MAQKVAAFRTARTQLRLVQGRKRRGGGGSNANYEALGPRRNHGGGGYKAKQNPLYKTSLCKNYMMGMYCQFAGKCRYAHGQHELRGGRGGGYGGSRGGGGFRGGDQDRGGRGGGFGVVPCKEVDMVEVVVVTIIFTLVPVIKWDEIRWSQE